MTVVCSHRSPVLGVDAYSLLCRDVKQDSWISDAAVSYDGPEKAVVLTKVVKTSAGVSQKQVLAIVPPGSALLS